jgi:predicted regulator of Ras-like GTPase activity (Roadblock/LC7/MglB family)
MLSSLFGDLRSNPTGRKDSFLPEEADQGFAATAILETVATQVNDHGQMVDRHLHDLVVTGSPAQAIRDHFASTRADLETATKLITLFDPTGVWAAGVVKALSDASGRPIERLHLREQGTLRTLAMIERTTLVRRHEEPLRIYHADVRAPGLANEQIPLALMERSNMTAVIVGAMQPHAVDDMLAAVQHAVNQPNWRCPTLLFMLPPNAVWIANKINTTLWPQRLRVQVLNESLTSASAVWNALLGMWNRVKMEPTWAPPTANPLTNLVGSIKVADLTPARPEGFADAPTMPMPGPGYERTVLEPTQASRALAGMTGVDGVLGCAVVDAATGLILARQVRDDARVHLDMAAAASTQVLKAHRLAARDMGLPDHVDEVMTSAGDRHHVMRSCAKHRGLFLFALLDKQRSNLALARYKLMEAEQRLG